MNMLLEPLFRPQAIDPVQEAEQEVSIVAPDEPRCASRRSVRPLNGRCGRCSCPGFQGVGWTCSRGGCNHHWDDHR